MVRLAVLIIFIGTVIGALMPAGGPAASDDRPGMVEVHGMAGGHRAGQSVESGSTAIVIERDFDGHFYADARVNGTQIRFLVDTGATGIALSRSDANSAGLYLSSGRSEVIGSGASGAVHGQFVRLSRVELGSTSVSDMPAVVLDGGDRSLLGQSFLSKFDSVEIRGDRMVLR